MRNSRTGIRIRSRRGDEAERLHFRRSPPAKKRNLKRHRAAALQDAGATNYMLLIPRGLGVRQPYAAFLTSVRALCSVPWRFILELRF